MRFKLSFGIWVCHPSPPPPQHPPHPPKRKVNEDRTSNSQNCLSLIMHCWSGKQGDNTAMAYHNMAQFVLACKHPSRMQIHAEKVCRAVQGSYVFKRCWRKAEQMSSLKFLKAQGLLDWNCNFRKEQQSICLRASLSAVSTVPWLQSSGSHALCESHT